MEITGMLTIYNSKTDHYGNRYWAVYLADCETFQHAQGTIRAENINTIDCRENLKWMVNRVELPIREFNRLVKPWPHLGCRWEEIRDNLLTQLAHTQEVQS